MNFVENKILHFSVKKCVISKEQKRIHRINKGNKKTASMNEYRYNKNKKT